MDIEKKKEEYIVFKGRSIPLPKTKEEAPIIIKKYFPGLMVPEEVAHKFAEHLYETPKSFKILEKKLLDIAGEKVIEDHPLSGLNWQTRFARGLIKNGKFYDEKRIEKAAYPEYTIDQNLHFTRAKYGATCNLICGYALDDDGIWKPHFWMSFEGKIIEATEKRWKKYYGYFVKNMYEFIHQMAANWNDH